MITADVPEALAKDPLSPILPSQLDTMVPSGMEFTGRMLPIDNEDINNLKLKKKELTFVASVDELAGVHAFNCDEIFNSLLVSVCVPESHFGKWCSSTWIMNDVLHNSLDVSRPSKLGAFSYLPLSLNIVKSSESSRSHSVSASGCEYKTSSVSLGYTRMNQSYVRISAC